MLVPPGRRAELQQLLERAAAGEATDGLETTRVRRDGRRVRVLLTVAPVHGPHGTVLGAAAVARPIEGR